MDNNNLEDIRTTLIKRGFLDVSYLTPDEVDSLLERQYGANWKEIYRVEEPKGEEKIKIRSLKC